MSFFNIAVKNVRKKFGSYLIYFISTIFSVTIFNLFCSMYYNPSFEAYRFGTGKMSAIFRASAIAVLIFSAIFVLFSNSYFIKTRKKEIAIYSLLGMRKEQIATMMFLETFIIGLLATLCGAVVGSFSCKFFTSLLMKFMAAGTSVVFSIEIKAIVMTVIAFVILFIISGIKAYKTIYDYKLIELLSASKQGEATPKFSVFGGIASVILLAVGYLISAKLNVNAGGMQLLFPTFCILVFVSMGTFLLFRNFIPMVLTILKHNKPLYYKTSNFISISQIRYRVKANSKMLCVVALLCATTITMISAAYSLYKGLEDSAIFYAPYSYLCKGISDGQHEEIINTVDEIGEVQITADDKFSLVKTKIQNSNYKLDKDEALGTEVNACLLSESEYQTIILNTKAETGKLSNNKTNFSGGLKDTECFFIDGNATDDYCKDLIGSTFNVLDKGVAAEYTITGVSLHKYIGILDLNEKPTLVVSDNVYKNYLSKASENEIDTFYGFMFNDAMASENTVAAINHIVPARFGYAGVPENVSYIGFYKSVFAMYGSYIFIGLFIGVLFMLAVGSVMYYKLIIEAQEEATRYEILRKTGMNKKEILFSIIKQLGLVYGLPLLVGLTHTGFALMTYNRTMDLLGQETPTLLNAAMVVLIYVITYSVFYALSVWNYFRIVWVRK